MSNVFRRASTNGRWGVQIAYPSEIELRVGCPVRGSLRPLGKVGGFTCFELVPDDQADTWIVVGEDIKPYAGCTVAHSEGLQSNSYVTILVCGAGALWQTYGYKRRSSSFSVLTAQGNVVRPDEAILLAAGLVKPSKEPDPIPAPPPLPSNLAAALQKAGLV